MLSGRPDKTLRQFGLLLAGLLLTGGDARAQTHVIDMDRAHASFWVRPTWIKRIEGVFPVVEGNADWNRQTGALRVNVRLDVRALQMNSATTLGWVQSEEFFNVEQYPWILFRSDELTEQHLREGGEVGGEVTVRGITRRVTFFLEPSTCEQPGIACPVNSNGQLSRSAFGMDTRRLAVRDAVHMELSVFLKEVAAGMADGP